VLALSTGTDQESVAAAIKAGAFGYAFKTQPALET
jgi:hypothetical protein